jgi:secreted trypsin-like serine protease
MAKRCISYFFLTSCVFSSWIQIGFSRLEQYNGNNIQQRKLSSRVVGGALAKQGEFPSFAYGDCGGTLIHPDIVLSVAHCRGYFIGETIQIGGIKRDGSDSELHSGIKEIVHPSYIYGNVRENKNDIMIVVLQANSTAPIQKLNFNSTIPADGQSLVVAGFGSTIEGYPYYGDMRKATVPTINFAQCNNTLSQFYSIYDDAMICAGGRRKDTCQGDSGGPIYTQDGVQVGLTSFGYGCGRLGYPGVYTRVSHYEVCETFLASILV